MSDLPVSIDPSSPVPPYEQVRGQLAAAITDGRLAVGTRLPPVRRFADGLGLAANTVARAYRELEAAGLVHTAGRAGTTVSAAGDAARARVAAAAADFAALARELGVDPAEAGRIVTAALSR